MSNPTPAAPEAAPKNVKTFGLLAEFGDADAILAAAAKVRDAGYSCWDVMTPYPVHGMDKAMGIKPTILPWLVLGAGLTGGMVALAGQYWFNTVDYPLIYSGKPFWSIPSNVPVAFELTILFSALTTFFGLFGLIKLPQHYHPAFTSARFKRVTDDRFFLLIEAKDPRFEARKTAELLLGLKSLSLEELKD